MAKTNSPHSPYHVIGDTLDLLGSFVRLGTTLVSQKIAASAGTANAYVHKNVDLSEMEDKLSNAAAGIGKASNYATHTDINKIVDDVALFARKHPIASLATGIALGTLAGVLAQHFGQNVDTEKPKSVSAKARTKRQKLSRPTKARTKANGTIVTDGKASRA